MDDVQGPKGKPQSQRKSVVGQQRGRVVELKSWKSRQRAAGPKPPRDALRFLFWLTSGMTVVASLLAVASVIPFTGQIKSVFYCWAAAMIASALAVVLYAFRHPLARRLLAVNMVCLALSFVVALLKVIVLSH